MLKGTFIKQRRVQKSNQSDSQWHYLELQFSEPDRLVQSLEIEGSGTAGLTLKLQLAEQVDLVELPQTDLDQLVIRAFSASSLDRLAAQTIESGPSTTRWVVEFKPDGILGHNDLPKSIISAHPIYPAPNSAKKIHIGFFNTKTAATDLLRRIRGKYPNAQVLPALVNEPEFAERTALFERPNTASTAALVISDKQVVMSARAVTPGNIGTSLETEKVTLQPAAALDRGTLDAAMQAGLDRNWDAAIKLYTKALREPKFREESLEMLGVAYERNSQLAQAKSRYKQLISEYPNGDRTSRVRQRLNSLIGINQDRDLRTPEQRKKLTTWRNLGHISQFYRRHSIDIEGVDKIIPIDALFTNATFTTRKLSDTISHEGRISLGHIQDFSDRDSDRNFQIQRLYWDTQFENSGLGFRVGRQSKQKAGILGRFDGVTLNYQQNKRISWNVVGGYQVQSSFEDLESERPFYGASAELVFLDGKVELSPFVIEQKRNGILDRRAVGSHLFWRTNRSLLTALVDYDIYHEALNNLYITASFDASDTWRFHGAYDFRRSPYLTTGNALIGQRFDDLSELEQTLLGLKLQDIAEDRTATGTTYRLGADAKIDDTWGISLDASTTSYSSTDTSLGIFGLPSRKDFYFTGQVRANNLFGDNSFTSLQLRYLDSDSASTSSVFLTNRFRLFDDWLVHPRVLASRRIFERDNLQQIQIRPSLRIDYRGFNKLRLEAEVGYDWSDRETLRDDIEMTGFFVRLGYRMTL